jgi:hypothetical protein
LVSTTLTDGLGERKNLIEVLAAIHDEGVNENGATIHVELERGGRVHAIG